MDNINADCVIYLNDIFEEKKAGSNISLMLQLGSEAEINNLFAALSKQGKVIFALQIKNLLGFVPCSYKGLFRHYVVAGLFRKVIVYLKHWQILLRLQR